VLCLRAGPKARQARPRGSRPEFIPLLAPAHVTPAGARATPPGARTRLKRGGRGTGGRGGGGLRCQHGAGVAGAQRPRSSGQAWCRWKARGPGLPWPCRRTWRASQLGVLPRSLVGREVERDRPMKRAQAAGVCVYAISSAGAPVPIRRLSPSSTWWRSGVRGGRAP
jgi:hypothetical protein